MNVTRKIPRPLPKPSAETLRAPGCGQLYGMVYRHHPAEISAAFRIEDEAGIGFWDALMVAAARKAGATRILSEDLNSGQIIAGVRIENPFSTADHL